MSGGSLNYFYASLEDHVGDFRDKELDDLVKDLADLFYALEWCESGDTCDGDYREAKDKFKAKWFGKGSRKKRIEKYLEEIKADVMAQFCEDDRKCMNCNHWKLHDKSEKYGDCDLQSGRSWHRSEVCKMWDGDTE